MFVCKMFEFVDVLLKTEMYHTRRIPSDIVMLLPYSSRTLLYNLFYNVVWGGCHYGDLYDAWKIMSLILYNTWKFKQYSKI